MATRRRDRFRNRRGLWARGSKLRRIVIWLLVGLGSFIVLLAVAYYQLLSHLQSPAFCRRLSEYAQKNLKAEHARLGDTLQIEGNRISLPEVELTHTNMLQKLTARGINMEIDRGALWDQCLALRKLTVEEAELRLALQNSTHPARGSVSVPQQGPAQIPAPIPAKQASSGSLSSSVMPNRFSLELFECQDSDVYLQLGELDYSLHGCISTATPQRKLGRNVWQINLENGRLHTPFTFLRDTSIKNATLITSPREISLTESRLLLTPGELRVRGSYNHSTKRWSTILRANKANIARILNADWKKRLHGEMYGELELTGLGITPTRGNGFISLQRGVLEGLPILSQLPFNNTYPYRTLKLDKAECRLSYPYNDPAHNIRNAWLFDKIDIRSANGLLQVQGHVIIGTDRSLSGTLSIGLPENRFNDIQLQLVSGLVGQKDELGYMWFKLNLSGTLDDPQEDLSVRLATIISQALPRMSNTATQGIGNIINTLFPASDSADTPTPREPEESTPEPDTPIKRAGKLFQQLLPL